MNKRKLILFTDRFPYGFTNRNFLNDEFPYLHDAFDVTIVSSDEELENCFLEYDDVPVYRYYGIGGKNALFKVINTLKYIFSPCGIREIYDIIKLRHNIRRNLKDSLYYYWSAQNKYSFMKRNGILKGCDNAVFYAYWNNFTALSIALHKNRFKNIKLLSRLHRYDLYNERNGFRQPFKKYVAKKYDKLSFICNEGQEYFEKVHTDKYKSKYMISRLGIHDALAGKDMPVKSDDTFLLVSCGNVIRRKRIDLIPSALAKIDGKKIKWVHFGDGEEMNNLRAVCKELLDNKSNISYELKGDCDNSEVLNYYKNNYCDAFILCSSSEGMPVTIMEALCLGIPVITTDVGGTKEMVEGGGNIVLNKNCTLDEIKDAILKIASYDKETTEKIREYNRSIYEKTFNADKNYKEFVGVLKNL